MQCGFFGFVIPSASQSIRSVPSRFWRGTSVHIERWLMTEDMDGDGLARPDQIVVSWFKSSEAKAAFENDPEFVELAKIRDEAVKLVTITGHSVFGD